MKSNYYNHHIVNGANVLLYNALTKGYLMMKRDSFEKYTSPDGAFIPKKIESESLVTYNKLVDNGFIVEDDFDEIETAISLRQSSVMQKRSYRLIINTTLDCNLGCWYCYESHKKGSQINKEIIDRIIRHIEFKYAEDHIEFLDLSFFGGEPLLRVDKVAEIIKRTKEYADAKGISLNAHFTTNGTLVTERFLSILKGMKSSFQITLDGSANQHNSVRHYKNKTSVTGGTYDRIITNIKKILCALDDTYVRIRINYSSDTFNDLEGIIDSLSECDRKKIDISLQQVWQKFGQPLDKKKILDFVRYANQNYFYVDLLKFGDTSATCYADKLNTAVINFDGTVYKCTARDFVNENSEGIISPYGMIFWEYDKINRRLYTQVPKICKRCKLFPSCSGICSQKIIEGGENVQCILDNNFTVNDYISMNFNNKILKQKISEL